MFDWVKTKYSKWIDRRRARKAILGTIPIGKVYASFVVNGNLHVNIFINDNHIIAKRGIPFGTHIYRVTSKSIDIISSDTIANSPYCEAIILNAVGMVLNGGRNPPPRIVSLLSPFGTSREMRILDADMFMELKVGTESAIDALRYIRDFEDSWWGKRKVDKRIEYMLKNRYIEHIYTEKDD